MKFPHVEYVELDKAGRVVIPKAIRNKIHGDKVLEIYYDEEHDDIHLKPVKPIESFVGAFKGIKKSYAKNHEEDWREYPDR